MRQVVIDNHGYEFGIYAHEACTLMNDRAIVPCLEAHCTRNYTRKAYHLPAWGEGYDAQWERTKRLLAVRRYMDKQKGVTHGTGQLSGRIRA